MDRRGGGISLESAMQKPGGGRSGCLAVAVGVHLQLPLVSPDLENITAADGTRFTKRFIFAKRHILHQSRIRLPRHIRTPAPSRTMTPSLFVLPARSFSRSRLSRSFDPSHLPNQSSPPSIPDPAPAQRSALLHWARPPLHRPFASRLAAPVRAPAGLRRRPREDFTQPHRRTVTRTLGAAPRAPCPGCRPQSGAPAQVSPAKRTAIPAPPTRAPPFDAGGASARAGGGRSEDARAVEARGSGRSEDLNWRILLISASESLSAGAAGSATVQVKVPYMLASLPRRKRPGQEPTRHISHQPNNKRSPDPPPIRTLDKLTEVESG